MARKPLLTTPVLSREDVQSRLAGDDLMSRVIGNDAAKHGRTASPTPQQSLTPEEAFLQEINITNLQESNKERKQEITSDSLPEDPLEAGSRPEPGDQEPAAANREKRLAKALEVAAGDEMIVVTVRVPAKLNDYIDQYVARVGKTNPKRRYRKQDALAEALAGFIADHPMPAGSAEEHF